jgi:hypothetical protein
MQRTPPFKAREKAKSTKTQASLSSAPTSSSAPTPSDILDHDDTTQQPVRAASPANSTKSTDSASRASSRIAIRKANEKTVDNSSSNSTPVISKKRRKGQKTDKEEASPKKPRRTKATDQEDNDKLISLEKRFEEGFAALTKQIEDKFSLKSDIITSYLHSDSHSGHRSSSCASSRFRSRSHSHFIFHSRSYSRSSSHDASSSHAVSTTHSNLVQTFNSIMTNQLFGSSSFIQANSYLFSLSTFQLISSASYSDTFSISDALSRYWPWIDQTHIINIIAETFDVNNLSKLLRDENARRKHLTHTIDDVVTNFCSDKQKILMKDTKLQFFFLNLQTFLLAFSVYAVICTAFEPKYDTSFLV